MWILEIPKLKLKIMHNFSKISWMDKAKVVISQFLRKQLKKINSKKYELLGWNV